MNLSIAILMSAMTCAMVGSKVKKMILTGNLPLVIPPQEKPTLLALGKIIRSKIVVKILNKSYCMNWLPLIDIPCISYHSVA